ncbi:MAG: alanyl-tRNA editing protein [Deinococcales bacterium]
MTHKLYRQDAYLQEFTSCVLEVQQNLVRLESTAFYPSAGGQAFDTGTLGGVRVLEVQEKNGVIWHTIDGTLDVGQVVQGKLDWARRFDHMQQHTGEHLLGQAFFRQSHHVIAVNMEHAVCTLDLAQSIDWESAMQAEADANAAIWASLPIRCYEILESNINQIPLRRTPQVTGMIRVVQIGEYDYSACGGTHTRFSSEVGMLKIFKLERIKSGATRVYFNCGARLLADYRIKHDLVSYLGRHFSTSLEQVPSRTFALLEEFGNVKKILAAKQAQLAQYLAASFQTGVVMHELEHASMLSEVAKICAQRPNLIALLAAKDAEKALLAVACGTGISLGATELLKIGLPFIDGKGGGNANIAQGSGTNPQMLALALEAMRDAAQAKLE